MDEGMGASSNHEMDHAHTDMHVQESVFLRSVGDDETVLILQTSSTELCEQNTGDGKEIILQQTLHPFLHPEFSENDPIASRNRTHTHTQSERGRTGWDRTLQKKKRAFREMQLTDSWNSDVTSGDLDFRISGSLP